MKELFEKVLEFCRNKGLKFIELIKSHKVISSVSASAAVLIAAVIIVVVNNRKAAVTVASLSSSSQLSNSSTAISSSSAASKVSSSSAVSQVSSSSALPGSQASSTAGSEVTTSKNSSSKAKTDKTTSNNNATQSVNTDKGMGITPANSDGNNTADANDPRYVQVPWGSAEEKKHTTVSNEYGTEQIELNINACYVQMQIDTSKYKNYLLDDLFIKFTNNSTGKVKSTQIGCINNNSSNPAVFSVDFYEHDIGNERLNWVTPNTYSVYAYCQESEHSKNKDPNRPQQIAVANFKFSVWEQGFKN